MLLVARGGEGPQGMALALRSSIAAALPVTLPVPPPLSVSARTGAGRGWPQGFCDQIRAGGWAVPAPSGLWVTRPVCSDLVPGPLGGINEGQQLGLAGLLGHHLGTHCQWPWPLAVLSEPPHAAPAFHGAFLPTWASAGPPQPPGSLGLLSGWSRRSRASRGSWRQTLPLPTPRLPPALWVPCHASFPEAAAPRPRPRVTSLLLSGSSTLSRHIYLKVTGTWLLCSTPAALLLESPVGLVPSPSWPRGVFQSQGLFSPRWHPPSPAPGALRLHG